jgi:hypothetical protein
LAWNGIVAWYLPLAVFASWLIINPICLSKAVDTMPDDETVAAGAGLAGSNGSELARLRADVDRLLAGAAR